MAEVTMEQLLQKSNQIQKLMAVAVEEQDPDKAKVLADQLTAEGRALEELGKKYHDQELLKRTGGKGTITVMLTPDQRKRILTKTGIALESLVIDDEAGAMNQAMPTTQQEHIEGLAMKEAERRKNAAEADRIVRAELDRAMEEIEAVGNSELSEQLRVLKADPNFAGGMLQKK